MEEVSGGRLNLHNECLQNVYSSLNIIKIKSRRMISAGYVVCIDEKCVKRLVEKPKVVTWKTKGGNREQHYN
jgi:hypothetical protein